MADQTVNPVNGEPMPAAADRTFREVCSRKPIREGARVIGKAAALMLGAREFVNKKRICADNGFSLIA